MKTIPEIAEHLNELAANYDIGRLQEIRKELKGFSRRPGSKIFSAQTIEEHYAFHHGGRSELQYNIGFDGSGGKQLRHGVAFSLEPSQTLPDIEVLRPNIARFNEYIAQFAQRFPILRMWHYEYDYDAREYIRSEDYLPCPIQSSLIEPKNFIFAGWINPIKKVDCDQILGDFDRLLPLYRYVESKKNLPLIEVHDDEQFNFTPGCTIKKTSAKARRSSDPVNVSLRHNVLQEKLYQQLVKEYGKKNVGTEHRSGNGMRIDAVVRAKGEHYFYEIKTYSNARACLRDAIGQLLEYSEWPGGQNAKRLIVVGEPRLCRDGKKFLKELTERYGLPVEYLQLK